LDKVLPCPEAKIQETARRGQVFFLCLFLTKLLQHFEQDIVGGRTFGRFWSLIIISVCFLIGVIKNDLE
jgi:hypothetical protein